MAQAQVSPAPGDASPRFRAFSTRRLRKRGLAGRYVLVLAGPGGIEIAGENGGRLCLDWSEIRRLRVGFEESRTGRHFSTRLWLRDGYLELTPDGADRLGYRATMQCSVSAMIAAGLGDRVEGGASVVAALLLPLLMGILALVAIVIAVVVLTNEPWWGRMLVPAVPTVLTGIGIWLAVRSQWPRRIVELSDLDRQLPP